MVNIYMRLCGYSKCLCLQLLFAGMVFILCPVVLFSHSSVNSSLINKDASGKLDAFYVLLTSSLDQISDQVVCHDESTADIIFTGAYDSLEWTNDNTSIGLAADGTGNILSFTATNTGTSAEVATITVTPYDVANDPGTAMVFTITVNPTPDLEANPLNQAICPGEAINNILITNTNAVTGTTFFWTRSNTAVLTGIDENGTDAIISGVLSSTAPATIQLTVFTITASANGCTSLPIEASVNVGDTVPPSFVCPGNLDINLDANCQFVVPDLIDGLTGTDNCGAVSFSQNPLAGSLISSSHNQVHIVTITALDMNGNTATCEVILTEKDITPPAFACLPDQDVNLTLTCELVVPNMIAGLTGTDNCGTVTFSQTPAAGTSLPSAHNQTHIVTITAIDGNGNTTDCTVTLTGKDVTPPSFICPGNLDINLDANCQFVVPDLIVGLTGTDNCGTVSFSQNPLAGSQISSSHNQVHIVTITAFDVNGNTATCEVILTGKDITPPAFECPPDQDVNLTVSCELVVPNMIASLTGTDNCGTVTFSQNPAAGTSLPSAHNQTHIVTITAIDGNGNTTDCTVTLTGKDVTPPSFICPGNLDINLDANCQFVVPDLIVGLTGTDNCGTVSFSQNPLAGSQISSSHNQVHIVTITAFDVNGNTATCEVILTGKDITPPAFECPPDQDVNLTVSCELVVPNMIASLTGIDNCGTVTFSQNPAAGTSLPSAHNQTHIVTITAIDGNGNTTDCTVTLTGKDVTPPSFICPGNLDINLDANCQFVVPDLIAGLTGTDNCGAVSFSQNPLAGSQISSSHNQVHIVTITALDMNGNTATCEVILTGKDITPPAFECPPDQDVNLTLTCELVVPNMIAGLTGTDNCGTVTFSQNPAAGTSLPSAHNQTHIVTITAIDGNGNTTDCTVTLTGKDVTPPTFTLCPSNINLNSPGNSCSKVHNPPQPSFTDNCGVVSALVWEMTGATTGSGINYVPNTSFNIGVTNITYTATDAAGNSAQCSFTVTVTDNSPPVIENCPADIPIYSESANPASCSQIATWTEPTATDNCTPEGDLVWTQSHTPGMTFPVGTTEVIYTVTDAGGNTSVCTFNVTVVDNTPPNFTVPNDITINTIPPCAYNAAPAVTGNVSGITDNCPAPTGGFIVTSSDFVVDGPCSGTFDITRTWSVTDAHGNTTTQDQIIRVRDNIRPSLSVPGNIEIECNLDPYDLSVTGAATATDNCGGDVVISYTDEIVDFPCPPEYNIIRTWRAEDCSGNIQTGQQTIRVRSNEKPIINNINFFNIPHYIPCPEDIPLADISIIDAESVCGGPITVDYPAIIPFGLENQPGYCPDSLHFIYRVSDECGNYIDVIHRIIVEDKCDCSPCANEDFFYTIDLRGNPDSIVNINNQRRGNYCCETSNCIAFNIILDPGAVGIEILVDGARPPAHDWLVNCSNTPILDGNTICIPPGVFHLFVYCKPGGDRNDWQFTSIAGVVVDEEIKTRVSCNTQLSVSENVTVPVWNSVSPGYLGQYNHYLDITDPYNPTFFPDAFAPPIIKYQVCANLPTTPCVTEQQSICNTVTVYVLGEIYVEFDQDPGAYCQDDIPEITATVYPGGTTYNYEWFDGPDATGNLVATIATYKPVIPGMHSLRVRDVQDGVLCSEYTFNFNVAPDDTPPVITAPADLVLECNDPTNLQQIQDWRSLATAVDDHTENLYIYDDYIGITEFCNSEVIITFWADDDCENRGTATARIIIQDTRPPELDEVPPPIVIGPDPETCEVAVNDVNLVPPLFTDDCDGNIIPTHNAPALFPPGETLFTWTATDACGNIATVIQSVTVFTADPPIVECPSDVLVPSAVDNCGAFVTVPPPNVTDPCPHTVTNDSQYRTSDFDASGFYPIGTTIVTWTITGISDNVTTCIQEITVTDLDPWVTCPVPSHIEVPADYGLPYNNAVVIPATDFGDNCPDPLLSWTMTPPEYFADAYDTGDLSGNGDYPSPNRFYVGVSTITYTVTDSHDNTATCFFTITITSAPIIECPDPDDIIVDADTGECISSLNPGIPTLVQGAQPIEWTWTLTNPDGTVVTGGSNSNNLGPLPEHIVPTSPHEYDFQVGTTTITWTATNMSGVDSCSHSITVIDDQPPTFSLPDPFTECVDLLFGAVYTESNPNPNIGIDPNLILNPSPDYYTFFSGNTALDITAIADNCCDPVDMTIYWRIDFTNTPDPLNPTGPPLSHASIDGTGQPSTYGSNMIFHGDGVNFTNVTHTITYRIVDCNGLVSAEQTQTIVITHRPQINKLNGN